MKCPGERCCSCMVLPMVYDAVDAGMGCITFGANPWPLVSSAGNINGPAVDVALIDGF